MRVGQIVEAEKVAGSRKLMKLRVDIGDEVRQVVAGIAEAYDGATLLNRKVKQREEEVQAHHTDGRSAFGPPRWPGGLLVLSLPAAIHRRRRDSGRRQSPPIHAELELMPPPSQADGVHNVPLLLLADVLALV